MKTSPRKTRDSYMELIRRHPLRHLRTTAEYAAASKVLQSLVMRDEKTLDDGENDYLEAMEDLIDAYDDKHGTLNADHGTPTSRLNYLLEQNKLTMIDLSKLLGVSPALASMMMSGQRAISRASAKKLGERFRVDPGLFI